MWPTFKKKKTLKRAPIKSLPRSIVSQYASPSSLSKNIVNKSQVFIFAWQAFFQQHTKISIFIGFFFLFLKNSHSIRNHGRSLTICRCNANIFADVDPKAELRRLQRNDARVWYASIWIDCSPNACPFVRSVSKPATRSKVAARSTWTSSRHVYIICFCFFSSSVYLL